MKRKFIILAFLSLFLSLQSAEADVIITNGDTNLSAANGFYRVESSNLGAYGAGIGLTSVRTINVTFANAGNAQGVILGLYPYGSFSSSYNKSIIVELKDNGVTIASKTLTADQMLDDLYMNSNALAYYLGTWYVPFVFDTPAAVTTDGGRYTIVISHTVMNSYGWILSTSNGVNPFYAIWCDNQVSFSDNDTVIAKDVLTIDKTATMKGTAGTGDATRAPALIIVKGGYPPATPPTANVVWQNPPASSYTLTIDGVVSMAAHSGFQIGSAASPIPIARQAVLSFASPTVGTGTNATGFQMISIKTNLYFYGATPAVRSTTLANDALAGQNVIYTTDTTGWSINDSLWVGGQVGQGSGSTVLHKISAINGTEITLDSNLVSSNRRAGHPVMKLSGYGIRIEGLGATNALRPINNISIPTNFIMEGVENYNVDQWYMSSSTGVSNDMYAYYQPWSIKNSTFFNDIPITSYPFYFRGVSSPPTGLVIDGNYAVRQPFFSVGSSVGQYQGLNPPPTEVKNNIIMTSGASNETTVARGTFYFHDNIFENYSYAHLAFHGTDSMIYNNKFWGNSAGSGALQIVNAVNLRGGNNFYDNNSRGLSLAAGITTNSFLMKEQFSTDTANTFDVSFEQYSIMNFDLISPTISSVNTAYIAEYFGPNSELRIEDYNNTPYDGRSYMTYGRMQRTGVGLPDETNRPASPDEFATRFEPVSLSAYHTLARYIDVPVGNAVGSNINLSIWVKINSASYYALQHVNPTLRVEYDGPIFTQVSDVADNSTDWQQLSITFSPTTTQDRFRVYFEAATAAGGVDSYVYWDDLAASMDGVALPIDAMNVWAAGIPVVPPVARGVDANSLWGAMLSNTPATGSYGEMLQRALGLVSGTVQAAPAPTATTFTTDLPNTNSGFYNNAILVFRSGNLSGQARMIFNYNGVTKAITVDPALYEAPAASDVFAILSSTASPTAQQVWNYGTRQLTSELLSSGALAKSSEVSAVATQVSGVQTTANAISSDLSDHETAEAAERTAQAAERTAQGTFRSNTATSLAAIKTETDKIPAIKTETDKIASVKAETDKIKAAILNRETSLKSGSTLRVRYRSITGLLGADRPDISVYDAGNVQRVAAAKMSELGTTGVYAYDLTLDAGWGTGDFTVQCSDATTGQIDAMTLSVLTTDLEDIRTALTDTDTALYDIDSNIDTLLTEVGSGRITAIKTSTDTIAWADVAAIKTTTDTINWQDVASIMATTDTINWEDVGAIKATTDTINWGNVEVLLQATEGFATTNWEQIADIADATRLIQDVKTRTDTVNWEDVTGIKVNADRIPEVKARTDTINWEDVSAVKSNADLLPDVKAKTDTINWPDVSALLTSIGAFSGTNWDLLSTIVDTAQTLADVKTKTDTINWDDVTAVKANAELIPNVKARTDTINWEDVTAVKSNTDLLPDIKARTDTINWEDVTAVKGSTDLLPDIKAKTDTINWDMIPDIKTITDTINWSDVKFMNADLIPSIKANTDTLPAIKAKTDTINWQDVEAIKESSDLIPSIKSSTDLLPAMKLTLENVHTDTQDLVANWGTYTSSDIMSRLEALALKVGSLDTVTDASTIFGIMKVLENKWGPYVMENLVKGDLNTAPSAPAQESMAGIHRSLNELRQTVAVSGKTDQGYALMVGVRDDLNGLLTRILMLESGGINPLYEKVLQVSKQLQATGVVRGDNKVMSLYDVSVQQAQDLMYLKERLEELKALADYSKDIVAEKKNKKSTLIKTSW